MEYRIRFFREQLNLSQDALAKLAGVSRATISGLESGAIKITTTETLVKIAGALGKKVSDIFLA